MPRRLPPPCCGPRAAVDRHRVMHHGLRAHTQLRADLLVGGAGRHRDEDVPLPGSQGGALSRDPDRVGVGIGDRLGDDPIGVGQQDRCLLGQRVLDPHLEGSIEAGTQSGADPLGGGLMRGHPRRWRPGSEHDLAVIHHPEEAGGAHRVPSPRGDRRQRRSDGDRGIGMQSRASDAETPLGIPGGRGQIAAYAGGSGSDAQEQGLPAPVPGRPGRGNQVLEPRQPGQQRTRTGSRQALQRQPQDPRGHSVLADRNGVDAAARQRYRPVGVVVHGRGHRRPSAEAGQPHLVAERGGQGQAQD